MLIVLPPIPTATSVSDVYLHANPIYGPNLKCNSQCFLYVLDKYTIRDSPYTTLMDPALHAIALVTNKATMP